MDKNLGSSQDLQTTTTRYIPQGPTVKHDKEDLDRTLAWIPNYLDVTCVVTSPIVVLGVLWCQDSQKVNSVRHENHKRVSQYTLGMGELNYVVVLSSAQLYEMGLLMYNRVHEVPFYIPQGYVKGHSIYWRYVEESRSPRNVVRA